MKPAAAVHKTNLYLLLFVVLPPRIDLIAGAMLDPGTLSLNFRFMLGLLSMPLDSEAGPSEKPL